MEKYEIESLIKDFVKNSELNTIGKDKALNDDMIGLTIYDEPLIGYIASDNSYIAGLKNTPEANVQMEPPEFWLPGAQSVVSIFFPYTKEIRKSNIIDEKPSTEWLHGRIEGQEFINALLKHLKKHLKERGVSTAIPMFDERFKARMGRDVEEKYFSSNWSERHVAYAAGLGTFSLTKGMITPKGMAGRFGSIITDVKFEPSPMPYDGLYDNCTMCGACIKRCPKNAISMEHGKIHKPCSDYLDDIRDEHPPYYGCGKCQVGVPCENRIPR